MNQDAEPCAKLWVEDFAHNNDFGAVDYICDFTLENLDNVLPEQMLGVIKPILLDFFYQCFEKMRNYGHQHDIYTDHFAFIIRSDSDQIPFNPFREMTRPHIDFYDLMERTIRNLHNFGVDWKGQLFTVLINGFQTTSSPSAISDILANNFWDRFTSTYG